MNRYKPSELLFYITNNVFVKLTNQMNNKIIDTKKATIRGHQPIQNMSKLIFLEPHFKKYCIAY